MKMANIVGLDLNIDQDYLAEAVRQTVIMGISEIPERQKRNCKSDCKNDFEYKG